jgi:hypothetical protein
MRILFAIALLTLACASSGCTFFTRGDDHERSADDSAAAAPSEEAEAPR